MNLGLQKVIPLLLLIVVGYLLRGKFQQPAAGGAIKNLIINAALPATIFLSVINIDTKLGLFALPALALVLNFYLLFIGLLVAPFVIKPEEKARFFSFILMFPALAPGLTAYPFIEEFLGSKSLAWAALADVGNKLFILVGLYALALYWYQKVSSASPNYSEQLKMLGLVFFGEPANAAIILAFLLMGFNLTVDDLPKPLFEIIPKLAACTTPLILFFVGISFNPKTFNLKTVLSVLFVRAGAGFWFSAGAIAFLKPDPTTTALAVILPQSGCSMWPFLHATQMNARRQPSSEKDKPPTPQIFDTEFALGLLTISIPFSICVNLIVCSSRNFLSLPLNLGLVGTAFWFAFGILTLGSDIARRTSGNLEIEFSFKLGKKKQLNAWDSFKTTPQFTSSPRMLDAPRLPNLGEHYSSIEPALNQVNLQVLGLLLEYRLQSEGLQDINLIVNFSLVQKKITIIAQHPADKFPDENKIFRSLKQEVILFLKLKFPLQVNLYLHVKGEKRPYASVFFVMKPS